MGWAMEPELHSVQSVEARGPFRIKCTGEMGADAAACRGGYGQSSTGHEKTGPRRAVMDYWDSSG